MAEKFAFTYEQKKRMARQTAEILTEEIGLKGDAIEAVELIPDIEAGNITLEEVEKTHGPSVSRILHGLNRIQQLYDKNPAVESENFRNLLLSFAEDMRVILIMIANRVNLMRQMLKPPKLGGDRGLNEGLADASSDPQPPNLGGSDAKMEVSQEAAYLYTQHQTGDTTLQAFWCGGTTEDAAQRCLYRKSGEYHPTAMDGYAP